MFQSLGNYLKLAGAYVRFNFRAQLEYRGAFFSQVASMFLNDGVWVLFWILFFKRFPVIHGWQVTDVISLWAILTAGFGLAFGLTGRPRLLKEHSRTLAQASVMSHDQAV